MTKRRKIRISAAAALSALLLLLSAWALAMPLSQTAEAEASVYAATQDLTQIFTDYTRTELKEEYKSAEALSSLRGQYGEEYKDILDRADEVLHGEVRFDPSREFSTEEGAENRIGQYGDTAQYSKNDLRWNFEASDLLITGIYGVANRPFTVYVEADGGAELPTLVLTNHHGTYNNWRHSVYLRRGENTFNFYSFGGAGSGPVYICNPYTPSKQDGDVSLYIEGGDFYPVFEKGEDSAAFKEELKAYEEARLKDTTIPDLAELVTDFAFFTTTSSSLYQTYIAENVIDPQENMELWGNFFTELYEFNGIPTSEASPYAEYYDPRNLGVRLNFRYMQEYPNSGAYAFFYHIGFYNEHYWFANYNNQTNPVGQHKTIDYSIYAMGHEIGHMLDTYGRIVNETTNNMSATYTYLKVLKKTPNPTWIPYERSLKRLERDSAVDHEAYDDGKILYTGTTGYDHNYMVWWFLESRFPGFWGKLNNLYRHDADARSILLNKNERMAYYASIVTGVDLGAYFERWGMYIESGRFSVSQASNEYKELMKEAKEKKLVEEKFDRFYYADDPEYNFILTHTPTKYLGETPTAAVRTAGGKKIVTISGTRDPAFLGYEVRVSTDGGQNFSVAGFTRSVQFEDAYSYDKEPVYKVVAVNRFFELSAESEIAKVQTGQDEQDVCKVNDKFYSKLSDAIDNAKTGDTVYLYSDCSLSAKQISKDLTFTPGEGVHGEIRLEIAGNYLMMTSAHVKLLGREDARFVVDGGFIPRTYPPIYGGNGSFTAEYTDFCNLVSSMGGGAFMSIYADFTLKHCTFRDCTGKNANVIELGANRKLTVEDCTFSCEGTDIRLGEGSSLTFLNAISPVSLALGPNAEVKAEGFVPSEEALASLLCEDGARGVWQEGKIAFLPVEYTLTFRLDGKEYPVKAGIKFVFGEEKISPEGSSIVEYRETESGKIYRPGERLFLASDMTFECRAEKDISVSLLFKSGTKTYTLPFGGKVYLPRTDGADEIVRWTARSGKIYSAGGNAPAAAGELLPVYRGLFRYDFLVRKEYQKSGYAKYGETITPPEIAEESFLGWSTGGAPFKGETAVTGDVLYVAIFRGENDTVDLSRAEIVFEEQAVYTGEPLCPAFSVTVDGYPVGADCFVATYSENVDAGEGLLVLEGQGRAFGSVSKRFPISPRRLSAGEVAFEGLRSLTYTGSELRLTPTLKVGKVLLKETDYTLFYSDDLVNAGEVVITAVLQGNYAGEVRASYKILKADRPVPPGNLEAGGAKILSDLKLPANWEWQDGSLPVEGEGTMRAVAVYVGKDAENYKNLTAEIEITLSSAPENPNPENPNPENPDPENPNPENPNPENPDPENPNPEDPNPEDPNPEDPNPENPNPENPNPENPNPEDPNPENPNPEDPNPEDPNPEDPNPENPNPENPNPENPGGNGPNEKDGGDARYLYLLFLLLIPLIGVPVIVLIKKRKK